MGETLAQKIIRAHLLHGDMTPGSEIALRIDQTLTQDATGTMAYLEFETMGIPRVKTELSVAYVDHNTLQSGFENADDHRYLQTVAKKHGVWFSRPGNGICHQVQLERFGKPGKTLIGSDSHTPTGGGIGMLAFGAGGMDVAVAMGGGAYYITMPKMFKVNLTGTLRPFVTAKDISLELLRILSVKGGVGAIIEWGGPGIAALSVPERATITNMGTELGATTSIFPSDDVTRAFLAAEGREADFTPLASDPDAQYDRIIDIDLNTLQPMIACPHSPDNVVPVATLAGTKVDQVCIGSCTNSSLFDMLKVAALLRGRTIAPGVSLSISPGSKQVLTMLADCGALADILASGARLLECACGPCIGMGFSPNSGGVSLRTFNRNFLGRSGTKDAQVYLVSPETAVAAALTGTITDPQTLGLMPAVTLPEHFRIDDSAVLPRRTRPTRWRCCAGRTSGLSRRASPSATRSRPSSCSRWATTSRPTTLCLRARRSCPTARTSRSWRSSASRSATRPSRRAPGRPGTASSSAAATTGRARRASTRRSCRCISASAASWPRASHASTWQTSSTPASCR